MRLTRRLLAAFPDSRLLENTAATAADLYAIIPIFGPISGAHFNPVASFADAAFDGLTWRHAVAYLPPKSSAASPVLCSPTSCAPHRSRTGWYCENNRSAVSRRTPDRAFGRSG